jgi:transcriptional regulator with XRE-family HTH domain
MGPRIRELRQERGLTLAELAKQLGISASHMSRLERGATAPSFSVGAALARELGVTAQELATTNRVQGEVNTQLVAILTEAGLDDAVAREIQRAISAAARQELLHVLTSDASSPR